MASSVIRELEELRALLDTPKKTFSPLKTLKELSTPRADAVRSYSTALNGAEKSVDRLGRAIEAAEEEMDAALKRTTEIHRSQLKQKELELLELQRVIGAKDRSLDSLRDTLATTKRTYESKLAQSDSALALKDAEIKALTEELRVARLERDGLGLQLERAEAGRRAVEADGREREEALGAAVRAKGDEAAKALTALRYEKKEKEEWRLQCEEARRHLAVAQDELRLQREDMALMKDRHEAELAEVRRRCALEAEDARRRCGVEAEEARSRAEAEVEAVRRRCEAELEDMRRRLRSEKNLRRACEKWLRSELKSREEMELLLAAVKDAAAGRGPADAAADAADVEALIDRLRAGSPSPPPRSAAASPRALSLAPPTAAATSAALPAAAAGRSTAAHAPLAAASSAPRGSELDLLRAKLEEDNGRLKAELLAARKMLHDRLRV